MRILAWIAFIGFMIEAGAFLISYGISYFNPEAAKNFYNGVNLYDLRQYNFWYYTQTISFMVALSIMKAYVASLVIKTLTTFNISKPFTMEVAKRLEKISYSAFGIWLVSLLSNGHSTWLAVNTGALQPSLLSGDFIIMVGLVFIMAQVFKRGVEIQSENDLTV
jgi:hypothetical protein